VIGAVAAILGATIGNAFAHWFAWQKKRQALAAALAGEVQAVKAIAEFRRYREIIQSCIDQTITSNKVVYFTFSIDDHPFLVFEKNVGEIGFLPSELARQVTEFYTYARSVIQDFRTLQSQNLYNWPIQFAVNFMREMVRQ